MKKDAYYFPHFSNSRNDSKIMRLRRILGLEGYAIYFILLEILRDQTDFKYPLESVPEIEYELRISTEKIINVITKYDLFDIDEDNKFFSPKQILYLQPYIEKTDRARAAANIRWAKVKELKRPDANACANEDANGMQGEESKGKDRKGESGIYPNLNKEDNVRDELLQKYDDEQFGYGKAFDNDNH